MRYFILILLFCYLSSTSFAVEIEESVESDKQASPFPLIVLTAAMQGGSPGNEFSENYLGLTFKQFNTYENLPYFQASLKFPLSDDTRIGAYVGFNNISAVDNITNIDEDLRPIPDSELYLAEVDFSGIPIGVQYEYLPFLGQFRTFVGFGGGVELGEYNWNHRDLVEPEPRNQNNATINQSLVSPFIRINVGTELGFDKKWRSGFFAGLSADVSITRYFRSIDAFTEIEPFFYQAYSEESLAFFPWQVNFGLSLILNALD